MRAPARLAVSANRRHFVTHEGRPWFYLGDVAWTLLKRLDRTEVEEYFANRVAKGFTVIQCYVLRGLKTPNLYGELTLVEGDPARPNEAFFRNVDHVVDTANAMGLVMALVVTYGAHVRRNQKDSDEQILDPTSAFAYGKYLGQRYATRSVIWYLGGDRAPEDRDTWIAMARGLKDGCRGTQMVSYHGPGPRDMSGYSSSFWFHDQDWLDFNVLQSGHQWMVPCHRFLAHDYELEPVKPTLDMEPAFENHLVADVGRRLPGYSSRRAAYWNLLSGAAGHAYGCNDVYQFHDPGTGKPSYRDTYYPFDVWSATTHWRTALDFEGAQGMRWVHDLFDEYPWHQLSPDPSLIAAGQGGGELHIQAARARDGSFALAYLARGQGVGLRLDRLAAPRLQGWWYDPRIGERIPAGEWAATGTRDLVPPTAGEGRDWIVVLEDATRRRA